MRFPAHNGLAHFPDSSKLVHSPLCSSPHRPRTSPPAELAHFFERPTEKGWEQFWQRFSAIVEGLRSREGHYWSHFLIPFRSPPLLRDPPRLALPSARLNASCKCRVPAFLHTKIIRDRNEVHLRKWVSPFFESLKLGEFAQTTLAAAERFVSN